MKNKSYIIILLKNIVKKKKLLKHLFINKIYNISSFKFKIFYLLSI